MMHRLGGPAPSLALNLVLLILLDSLAWRACRAQLSDELARACATPAELFETDACLTLQQSGCMNDDDCCGYDYNYEPNLGGGNDIKASCLAGVARLAGGPSLDLKSVEGSILSCERMQSEDKECSWFVRD